MNGYVASFLQGVLQGATEYLPVSSSGHLSLFQFLTDFRGPSLQFDLLLHLATLLATLLYFRADIWQFSCDFFSGFVSLDARKRQGWRFGWAVVAATFVTGFVGLLIKGPAETAAGSPKILGCLWLVTAFLCFCAWKMTEGDLTPGLKIGLLVGLAQGFAVMPGVSRSGATITVALALGMSAPEAFRFSFLASLPAIAGAALLELKDVQSDALPVGWWLGFLAAFVVGLFCLALLRRVVNSRQWWPFALYCAVLGVVCLLWL